MTLRAEQEQEIEELRADRQPTRRATVPALEEILYNPLPVLDHGFIRVIDYMGDDAAIVQAARVSYGRGTRQVSSDRGLIAYLMRHRHTSPFEMCEIKLHAKMPIFVARQWLRHRTANVNEYSARYSILEREFYVPDADLIKVLKKPRKAQMVQERLFDLPAAEQAAMQSSTNKQGRDEPLDTNVAATAVRRMTDVSKRAFNAYEGLLGDEEAPGLARELARTVLPLSTYTQLYWKVDLHNLLHFIQLRADGHAQYEIRVYADLLLDIVQRWVPLTAAAYADYRGGAVTISARGKEALRRRMLGEAVGREAVGMSAGEWRELVALFPELEPAA